MGATQRPPRLRLTALASRPRTSPRAAPRPPLLPQLPLGLNHLNTILSISTALASLPSRGRRRKPAFMRSWSPRRRLRQRHQRHRLPIKWSSVSMARRRRRHRSQLLIGSVRCLRERASSVAKRLRRFPRRALRRRALRRLRCFPRRALRRALSLRLRTRNTREFQDTGCRSQTLRSPSQSPSTRGSLPAMRLPILRTVQILLLRRRRCRRLRWLPCLRSLIPAAPSARSTRPGYGVRPRTWTCATIALMPARSAACGL